MERTNAAEAPRLRRPSWRDPRLLAGVLLVLLSVVGVVMLVQTIDRSQGYWAAQHDLAPGTALEASQLTVVQAQLGDAGDDYLPADQPAPEGRFVRGTVSQGELLPAAAVVEGDPQSRQPVSLTLSDQLPVGTGVGDRVDVWVAEPEGTQVFAEPELVAAGAELAEVGESSGTFGTAGEMSLQVLLDPDVLPEVLDAKANGSRISVVPSAGGR